MPFDHTTLPPHIPAALFSPKGSTKGMETICGFLQRTEPETLEFMANPLPIIGAWEAEARTLPGPWVEIVTELDEMPTMGIYPTATLERLFPINP